MPLGSLRTAVSTVVFGRPTDTQEEHNLRNIVWSGAFVGFIDGGIWVFLPVYLARLGATPTIMGILAAGPQLVNMLLYLPAGAIVERQRDLVRLVNWTVLIHRCGYLVIAALPFFLPDSEIPLVASLIWTVINATTAFFWPALLVVIQRAVSPRLRPRATGGRWAAMTLVAAILIPTVGYVLDHTPFPTGYQFAFVLSFVGSLPNIYFFARVRVSPEESKESSERQPALERLRTFFAPFIESRLFLRYNIATAVFRTCLTVPAGLYSLFWVQNLHASDTLIGLRGMVGFASLAVAYWFWGRVAHHMGHRLLLTGTAILMAIYPAMTALAPAAEWLLPAAAIWGLSQAGIDIALVDLLLATAPEGRKPSAVAVGNLLASGETFVGPLLGAALAPLIGIKMAILASGALIAASAVFFLLLPSRQQEEELQRMQAKPVVAEPT